MPSLREAATQALEALEYYQHRRLEWDYSDEVAITALRAALSEYDKDRVKVEEMKANWALQRKLAEETQERDRQQREYEEQRLAALAEPEGGGNLPPPLQKPGDFDHGIGADRFKVVRGAFWWHVLIGDSPTEHGKFRSRASAEKMAADLLREFRNGAFVQHEAALAEPVQEPVAWRFEARHIDSAWAAAVTLKHPGPEGKYMRKVTPLYPAPPQRKPLTDEELDALAIDEDGLPNSHIEFARAIERAHGIGDNT